MSKVEHKFPTNGHHALQTFPCSQPHTASQDSKPFCETCYESYELQVYIYILASSQSYTTGYQGTGPEDGQRAVGQVAWSRLATHPEQSGVQVTTSLSHSPPSTNQSL